MKRKEAIALFIMIVVFAPFFPFIWLCERIEKWLDEDIKWGKK